MIKFKTECYEKSENPIKFHFEIQVKVIGRYLVHETLILNLFHLILYVPHRGKVPFLILFFSN